MVICLDAGHGMTTPGKQTPPYADGSVIKECEQNYPIMYLLKEELARCGFLVIMTNNDMQYDLSLEDRVAEAEEAGAEVFISLHKNAAPEYKWSDVSGSEAIVYRYGGNAETLAQDIMGYVTVDTSEKYRGVKEGNFYVLRETSMPAVLLELGFMTNKTDAEDMRNPIAQKRYAKAICKGVCQFFGVTYQLEADNVSEWAQDAYRWVKGTGISDGSRPRDNVTREELWTMLYRLSQL